MPNCRHPIYWPWRRHCRPVTCTFSDSRNFFLWALINGILYLAVLAPVSCFYKLLSITYDRNRAPGPRDSIFWPHTGIFWNAEASHRSKTGLETSLLGSRKRLYASLAYYRARPSAARELSFDIYVSLQHPSLSLSSVLLKWITGGKLSRPNAKCGFDTLYYRVHKHRWQAQKLSHSQVKLLTGEVIGACSNVSNYFSL